MAANSAPAQQGTRVVWSCLTVRGFSIDEEGRSFCWEVRISEKTIFPSKLFQQLYLALARLGRVLQRLFLGLEHFCGLFSPNFHDGSEFTHVKLAQRCKHDTSLRVKVFGLGRAYSRPCYTNKFEASPKELWTSRDPHFSFQEQKTDKCSK
jgi:hypothetical protein